MARMSSSPVPAATWQRIAARWLSALLLAAGMLGSALAQTSAATAEALMRKSGLWNQLEHVAPQVRAGLTEAFAQDGAGLQPSELARLARSVDAAYAPAQLRAVARATIARQARAGDVPTLLAWYGSATGVEVTRLEEAAAADTRELTDVVRQGLALLESLPEERGTLIRELVDVTRAAEALTTMTINTTVAIQSGVAAASPDAAGPSADALRTLLETQRDRINRSFAGVALGTTTLTYAELSDAELQRYVEFLKTAAGRRFTDVSMRALDAALARAAGELGRAIPASRDGANI